MTRSCVQTLLAVAVAGTGAPVFAQASIDVAYELPPAGLACGDAFTVVVRRQWPAGGEPVPFDAAALWPVAIELAGAEATANGDVQRYRARVFASGDVAVPPVVLRVRTAAGEVEATATPPRLAVRSRLPEPPGALEGLGDVREAPARAVRWWFAVLGAAVIGGLLWWRRPRRAAMAAPPATVLPLHERALARLAALPVPSDAAAVLPFHEQVAAIVREHAGAAFRTAVTAVTSEELCAAAPAGGDALRATLLGCDLVKFAAHLPDAAAIAATRDTANAFVRATAGAGGGAM